VGYLVIPCHVGTYSLAVTVRLAFADGGSKTRDVIVSSGTYAWRQDTLSLVDATIRLVAATMSWDTVIVAAPSHTYKLQAVAAY